MKKQVKYLGIIVMLFGLLNLESIFYVKKIEAQNFDTYKIPNYSQEIIDLEKEEEDVYYANGELNASPGEIHSTEVELQNFVDKYADTDNNGTVIIKNATRAGNTLTVVFEGDYVGTGNVSNFGLVYKFNQYTSGRTAYARYYIDGVYSLCIEPGRSVSPGTSYNVSAVNGDLVVDWSAGYFASYHSKTSVLTANESKRLSRMVYYASTKVDLSKSSDFEKALRLIATQYTTDIDVTFTYNNSEYSNIEDEVSILHKYADEFEIAPVIGNMPNEFLVGETINLNINNASQWTHIKSTDSNLKLERTSDGIKITPLNKSANLSQIKFTKGNEISSKYKLFSNSNSQDMIAYTESDPFNYFMDINVREASGSLEVYKTDTIGNKLEGVEFQILDGFYNDVSNLVTNEEGYARLDKLPLGIYYLGEIKTLDNLILNKNLFPFEIDEDGAKIVINVSNTEYANLTIFKTDAKTKEKLEGAKLKLKYFEDETGNYESYYHGLSNEYLSANAIAYVLTGEYDDNSYHIIEDETGVFLVEDSTGNKEHIDKSYFDKKYDNEYITTVDGINLNIPIGLYQVCEIKAPNGYLLRNDCLEFEVLEGENEIKIEFDNYEIETLVKTGSRNELCIYFLVIIVFLLMKAVNRFYKTC